MREEVISSGTMDQRAIGRSSSPPTPAASSVGASSPAVPANIGSIDWFGSAHGSAHDSKAGSLSRIGSQNARTSLSTNGARLGLQSEEPSCRPWERGDLLRRLATFKPSNWFEKPKEASSLACARKGWINIDTDKIECELCGIQLTFAALATSISAEVDSAEGAFAEKLDGGHKVACPWRGNCCADSLVQFPPALQIALIGGYKDRCDGLLQFPCLPVIASDAIENMKISRPTQMDSFLSQLHTYSSGEFGLRAENTLALEFSREEAINIYYKAQKLISLCGWEPRWLPNVQDYEEHSSQSARNADSFGPTNDTVHHYQHAGTSKNPYAASAIKDLGKKSVEEFRFNARFPLLDCSLCGATARIPEFLTVPRPARFGINNNDTPDISKKLVLTRGASAASGINGWVAADGMGKEHTEGRDDAATADDRKPLLNVGVDLNLTIAGGLPSIQPGMPTMSGHFNIGGMGRDLMIGQPAGSEVGDRAASYESRGPITRKRSLEEGGSTVDRPLDRIQQVDSIEGTVIDRDCDEVDDDIQYSCGPSKRVRELDMFSTYPSLRRLDPSGAGPSRTSCFDINIDVNRVNSFKEGIDLTVGFSFAKESARASSVIAMDTIGHSAKEDSMESVENYPGDENDVHLPSTSSGKNIDMNEALEFNYSSQAQQSTCLRPAAGSVVRETGVSSTNEGEEILNAETVNVHAHARDRFSFGISGGSVGMGASHEAEIHGIDVSIQRTDSTVGDTEPVAEVTENLGQTGESTPGPGLMDEFVPEEMDREDPHGDSQDRISQSVGKADYASKVYGSTKADSVESREKIGHTLGHESSSHLSLSRNAVICSGYEASKDEVTQKGKTCAIDDSTTNGIGQTDDENNYKVGEFDPIKHHNVYCPWVNGNVASAGCSNIASSSSSSIVALSGWELTLDALDTFQSQGLIPNQMVQSESAASLCKDDNLTPSQKLFTVHSLSKKKGKL